MHCIRNQGRVRSRQGAFTLVEFTIVLAILTVAIGLFTQTMAASAQIDPVSEQTRMASEAARMVLEDMRARPFAELFRSYNSDPADDPAGPGSAPGAWFDVPGLHAPAGAAGVGHLTFPTVGSALLENIADESLGMPHDLNGDGIVDGNDHSADAIILPVRVEIEWTAKSARAGKRKLTFYAMFARL